MMNLFRVPQLTPVRWRLAFAVAAIADVMQWALAPFNWVIGIQFIDVAAMILTSMLVGFHLVLLPTFILEFIPGISLLPTWTGCVALLVALRKKEQRSPIDIERLK